MHNTIPRTLAEWVVKQRQSHTCGQEIWLTQQRRHTIFFQEVAPSDYLAVVDCPGCHVALTPAGLFSHT